MRRIKLVAAVFVTGVLSLGAGDQRRTFGKSVQGKETVELTALANTPRDFADKSVRVAGIVVQVDPEKGAWLDIANDPVKGVRVRIRMPSDAVEFPLDAVGKHVIAEGLVKSLADRSGSLLPSAEDLGGGDDATAQKRAEAQVASEIQASGVVLE